MSYPYYETPVWYRCDVCKQDTAHPSVQAAAYNSATDSYGPVVCWACQHKEAERTAYLDELCECGFEGAV